MADDPGARDLEFTVDALFAQLALLLILLLRKGLITKDDLEGMFNAQSAALQDVACDAQWTAAELRKTDVSHYVMGRLRGLLEV